MNDPEAEELTQKLKAWEVRAAIPSDFQNRVWHRIASRQSARENSWWYSMLDRAGNFLARPTYAVATVALSVCTGIMIAKAKVDHDKAIAWKAMEGEYALSINPVAMQVHQSVQ